MALEGSDLEHFWLVSLPYKRAVFHWFFLTEAKWVPSDKDTPVKLSAASPRPIKHIKLPSCRLTHPTASFFVGSGFQAAQTQSGLDLATFLHLHSKSSPLEASKRQPPKTRPPPSMPHGCGGLAAGLGQHPGGRPPAQRPGAEPGDRPAAPRQRAESHGPAPLQALLPVTRSRKRQEGVGALPQLGEPQGQRAGQHQWDLILG